MRRDPDLTIEVRGLMPPSLNTLMRMAWRKREAEGKEWLDQVAAHLAMARGQKRFPGGALVRVTRLFPPGQPCDWDNFWACAKFPIDALVKLGVVPDDDPSWVTLEGRQEGVQHKGQRGLRLELWCHDRGF